MNVSTNAIEGLFSRMKASFRHMGVNKVANRRYSFYLAEYIYRFGIFITMPNGVMEACGCCARLWTKNSRRPGWRLKWRSRRNMWRSGMRERRAHGVRFCNAWKFSSHNAAPRLQHRRPIRRPIRHHAPPRPHLGGLFGNASRIRSHPRGATSFSSRIATSRLGVSGPAPAAEQVPPAPVEVAIPVAPLDPPREPVLPITVAIRCVPFGHAMQRCRITPEMHAEFRTWCERCQIGVLPGRFCHHCAVCDYVRTRCVLRARPAGTRVRRPILFACSP